MDGSFPFPYYCVNGQLEEGQRKATADANSSLEAYLGRTKGVTHMQHAISLRSRGGVTTAKPAP